MIGILYSRDLLRSLIKRKPSFEIPSFYVETAREAGEHVLFFSIADIDWRQGTVRGWNGMNRERTEAAIPPVIINRTRTASDQVRNTIRRLKYMGRIVFNEHNVYSKLYIHRILMRNESLHPHLPATSPVSRENVKGLLRQTPFLFLKPSTASVGNGIIRLQKVDEHTFADMNRMGRTKRKKVEIRQIVKLVKKMKRNYLAQQGILLMKYKGKPADFRVSVQKDGSGRWQCTGMVGKVARKKAIVTNLHCGGQSMKASELFQHWGWDSTETYKEVAALGVNIARTIERELPHIADLGLDIALDEERHPWFIEANFRDLRITFRDAGDKETWRTVFANPIHYAVHLIEAVRQQEGGSPTAHG